MQKLNDTKKDNFINSDWEESADFDVESSDEELSNYSSNGENLEEGLKDDELIEYYQKLEAYEQKLDEPLTFEFIEQFCDDINNINDDQGYFNIITLKLYEKFIKYVSEADSNNFNEIKKMSAKLKQIIND